MSELTPTDTSGNFPAGLVERAEAAITLLDVTVSKAVEIVAPGEGRAVEEVFTMPSERREDDKGLVLTDEQESALREAVAPIGPGRAEDISPAELGLKPGYVAVIEGGQPHKVQAELELALAGEPSVVFVSGTPFRLVGKTDERKATIGERASGARILGVDVDEVAENEYDIQGQVVRAYPGFEAEAEEILPFSYDIQNGFELGSEKSGQFVRIGSIGMSQIVTMRIDREDFEKEDGSKGYRKQPQVTDVSVIVDGVITAEGAPADAQIGFVTSSTYEPSRTVETITAWAKTGRETLVVPYGTDHLTAVKGEPTKTSIQQMPQELRKAHTSANALRELIQST